MKLLEETGLSRLRPRDATVNPAKLMGALTGAARYNLAFFADLIAVTTTP